MAAEMDLTACWLTAGAELTHTTLRNAGRQRPRSGRHIQERPTPPEQGKGELLFLNWDQSPCLTELGPVSLPPLLEKTPTAGWLLPCKPKLKVQELGLENPVCLCLETC